MKVLGIETATDVCGVAIVERGAVLSEVSSEQARVHAERLMVQVNQVLREAGLRVTDLGGIAVSIGPGSFTGLRIGLSVAKGLAWSLGIPLAAVSTLKAIAENAVRRDLVKRDGMLVSAIDARQGEIYCGLYEVEHHEIRELSERVFEPRQLVEELRGKMVTVTGSSLQVRSVHGFDPRPVLIPGEEARCTPSSVAIEGEKMLNQKQIADTVLLEPRYLKEFVPKKSSLARS